MWAFDDPVPGSLLALQAAWKPFGVRLARALA
jgi:hypothetical protein